MDHPHDQPVTIVRKQARDMLSAAQDVIQKSIETGDIQNAFNWMYNIRLGTQLAGLTMAYAMYALRGVKEVFGFDDDNDFIDAAAAGVGYASQTLKKYVQIWEHVILGCPEELRVRFLGFPVETLWLMTPAAKDGDLDEYDWNELALAEDKSKVRDIVRRIRGKSTSSESAVVISIQRDGTVMCRQGDIFEEIGFLNLRKKSDLAKKAMSRIIKGAGMVEQ